MTDSNEDIYTEPVFDPDALANLGPLRALAGIWHGTSGADVHPVADGVEEDVYVERYELQPIDPQTNGPQLLYGLRYHTHITKPGEVDTLHDQVGYWLWEPATSTVFQTIAIPRAQVAFLSGHAAPDDRGFAVYAELGSSTNGICSNPFLDRAFKTIEVRLAVTIHSDREWSYEQDTVLVIPGREALFHHTDRHTLKKVGEPTPNPTAAAERTS